MYHIFYLPQPFNPAMYPCIDCAAGRPVSSLHTKLPVRAAVHEKGPPELEREQQRLLAQGLLHI